MLIIKMIFSLIVSIVICKVFALAQIVLSLFVYEKIKGKSLKESDELLNNISERKLLTALIIIYLIASVSSTFCMHGLLILFNFNFALEISSVWFILRAIITFLRFKSNWKSYINDKIKLIQNKK